MNLASAFLKKLCVAVGMCVLMIATVACDCDVFDFVGRGLRSSDIAFTGKAISFVRTNTHTITTTFRINKLFKGICKDSLVNVVTFAERADNDTAFPVDNEFIIFGYRKRMELFEGLDTTYPVGANIYCTGECFCNRMHQNYLKELEKLR